MAFKSQPTVTRPANTTAYTAGDVVGGAFQFTGIPDGLRPTDYMITSAALRINVSAVPSGMTGFRIHLYDATPPSAIADNSAWDLASGDRANYLGHVDVGNVVDNGSTVYAQMDAVNKPFRTAGTGLWAYIVTNGGFTPAGNSEEYVPTIWAEQVI